MNKFVHGQADPRAPRMCQVSREMIQWVAPAGRKCWFLAFD